MIRRTLLGLLIVVALPASSDSLKHCGVEAKPCLEYGAEVFQARCSLCHGYDGFGEGILPMTLGSYPNTNLMTPRLAEDTAGIERVVNLGGSLPDVSMEMPPWGDELTRTQLDSVVLFVSLMRKDFEQAQVYLEKSAAAMEPNLKLGRGVFQGRCSLCHGTFGHGDGKMARIIKDPPPYDLTKSFVPEQYVRLIIETGGEQMGRSARMPPFGGDLSETEIESVVMFLQTLRED